MKIYTRERYGAADIRELSGFVGAVKHVCDRATALCESEMECMEARQDTLEGIVGTLLSRLYNGNMLTATQVQDILADSVTIVEE